MADEAKSDKKGILERIAESQVWKSIFRTGIPRNRRQRMMVVLNNVFLHLHPVRLPKHAVKVKYTWCMGGLSFFVFLVLTVITVWLHMFRVFMTGSYKPPREFNWTVGVVLLVLTMLLSFTGYLLPWDQLAIWAITVGSNMAGATPFLGSAGPGAALLKLGDVNFITSSSDARFALLGGRFVGEATLLRFYVLHCIGLPFVIMIFMIVHFWGVRKDGGISGPT